MACLIPSLILNVDWAPAAPLGPCGPHGTFSHSGYQALGSSSRLKSKFEVGPQAHGLGSSSSFRLELQAQVPPSRYHFPLLLPLPLCCSEWLYRSLSLLLYALYERVLTCPARSRPVHVACYSLYQLDLEHSWKRRLRDPWYYQPARGRPVRIWEHEIIRPNLTCHIWARLVRWEFDRTRWTAVEAVSMVRAPNTPAKVEKQNLEFFLTPLYALNVRV